MLRGNTYSTGFPVESGPGADFFEEVDWLPTVFGATDFATADFGVELVMMAGF